MTESHALAERARIIEKMQAVANERCDCELNETYYGSGEGSITKCEAHEMLDYLLAAIQENKND